MWNSIRLATRTVVVCLLVFSVTRRPSPAQQQPPQQPAPSSPTSSPPAQTSAPTPPPASTLAPQVTTIPQPVSSEVNNVFIGNGFSVTLYGWETTGNPFMGTGHGNGNTVPSRIDTLGRSRPGAGAVVSLPISKNDTIRISYFRMKGDGDTVTPVALNVYGTAYDAGTYLASAYKLQNVKISLDYLSWPFPVKDSRFHFKTLWEVQYTSIASVINAPYLNGTTSDTGTAVNAIASGSDWFIYPSLGVGFDYLASKNFYIEARASGFAFPHRSTIWDTEFSANYRIGKFALEAGGKVFHFKTSPERVEFLGGTFPGVYVGLRWYPKNGRY
jgi:hypothetical protein